MNRSKDPVVSLCERKFILEAIKESERIDGREVYDYREIKITLGKEPGHVEVTLGRTRVLARVSCRVIAPKPQRPTEGVLFFNVELSPMASPSFEVGKQSTAAVEISRILERSQKESRAVDTESLCIIAGQKVWEIRIDVHILDHCGNMIDCACIASITALKHFRRPDVTVIGEEATIHPLSERDPVPLSVHNMPLCFTFAFFSDGEYTLVDPSLEEEQVMEGKLVVGMNIHREICVLQMTGGVAILPEQVMRSTQIAAVKCVEITELIKKVMAEKGLNSSQEFESILENKRGKEEISEEVLQDHLTMKGEEEAEPMEDDSLAKTVQVNRLGPNTAELTGLGGENTWELIDSMDFSKREPATKECTQERKKSGSPMTAVATGESVGTLAIHSKKGSDSDSEEEETVELTGSDIAQTSESSNAGLSKLAESSESLASVTEKEKRTVGSGGSVSKKGPSKKTKKKGRNGVGVGGAGTKSESTIIVRGKKKGISKS